MARWFRSVGFPVGTRQPLVLSLCIVLLHCVLVFATSFWLQPEIPLWYSLPEKSQQLAPKMWLFVIPAAALMWFGTTAALARAARTVDSSLVQLFCWVSTGLQVLWCVVALRIIWITW